MEDESSCSSAAPGARAMSFLQRTLQRLSSTQCLKLGAEEEAAVAVVALQSNTLRTGADISITQCTFVYNERRLGHGFISIERLRCVAERSVVLPRVSDVSSLPMLIKHGMEESVVLQSDVPLQVSRKHYLCLWNNDDPEGDMWSSGSPSSDTVLDVSKITLLSSLESGFRSSWNLLPLLVKVIHKSRLRFYGKFGLKIDYPYQAYIEVADQSGTMSLVLWNELCPEFYQRLNVGTVLYLQNYTLKPSYPNRSRPQMDHHRMKSFNSIEICLNARNPVSIITVVSPKSVLPQWGLPEVSYQFTTRSELEKLANNSACDVIGLVTFVGRVERVKSKGNKGPEKYWTYRWVHAVDGTSGHPFILEIFSSSQPEIFNCYMPNSCETETFITGYHKGQPYVSHPQVKNFIQWTKTLKDNVVLQKTAVGGHYCYPCPPKVFTQSLADVSAQVPLVAVADLKRELETLQYREHKKLAVQGQITSVRYRNTPKITESQVTHEKEVPSVPTDTCEPDTQQHPSAAEQSLTDTSTSPSGEKISAIRGKRRIETRKATGSSLDCGSTPSKRRARRQSAEDGREEEEDDHSAPESEEAQDAEHRPASQNPNQGEFLELHLHRVDLLRIETDPHGNTMLSCLASGFLCPLSDTENQSDSALPQPEEILESAGELEDKHVVCILDLCHLGGEAVEVVINKIYRVSEKSEEKPWGSKRHR
ncbi:unnamed protein product [Pleuronectes platessa]|uniref:RPA1 related single stranded DNA binding protein n=1 Tax=Pleuronectes platessa TaxID=8262 RepID=A0A9N7YDQ8_PLEPL|nr:unnamed protein product [Pleuronectes platessa]